MNQKIKIATAVATERKPSKIEQEIRTLRSLFISIAGEDPEGAYRPQFVQEILKVAAEKPTGRFTGAASFLAALKRV